MKGEYQNGSSVHLRRNVKKVPGVKVYSNRFQSSHHKLWRSVDIMYEGKMSTPVVGFQIDREVALAGVGGDVELLREIVTLFLSEYPRIQAELKDAVLRGDAKGVERAAHGLKGSVSTFGANPAAEAALQLETMGRARDLSEVRPALELLETALVALRPELEVL
jgi:HPt (histidine-containing phosphotransfer) domain-containing protein